MSKKVDSLSAKERTALLEKLTKPAKTGDLKPIPTVREGDEERLVIGEGCYWKTRLPAAL